MPESCSRAASCVCAGRDRVAFGEEKAVVLMGRDRLVDQIAQAMARAENASEDHFEAYRHVAEAVAAVVEPLLAEKDKAAVEVVERLLRATMDNPDAGDLSVARHKAKQFLCRGFACLSRRAGEVKPACVHQWASVVSLTGLVWVVQPGRGTRRLSHKTGGVRSRLGDRRGSRRGRCWGGPLWC